MWLRKPRRDIRRELNLRVAPRYFFFIASRTA